MPSNYFHFLAGNGAKYMYMANRSMSLAQNENPELMVIFVAGNNPMRGFISIQYLNLMIQIHVAEVLLT